MTIDSSFPHGRPPPTGIQVIVIGLGIAGLAAAIECQEKGHSVTAFERANILTPVGDSIGLGPNGARIIARWGNGKMRESISRWVSSISVINIHNATGKRILAQELPDTCDINYLIPRYRLLEAMFNHAREIGVKMHLGQEINRVWEGKSSCGIIIDGKKLHADCIISCDGVHSATRSSIINHSPTPRASGYAAYRALIEGKSIAEDPEARWILEGSESRDKFEVFFVGDTQLFLQTANKGAEVIWLCFHKDSRPVVDESNTPANPNDVLNIIKDWPVAQKLWAVIRHTPSHKFIDYPFFDRDPLPTWRSQKGRMMLAGDAAHYFSPGGGQGASQALEDANVIATCLRIAGRDNVPVALQIAENIRHPRATAVQLLGHRATEAWQKQNIGYAEEGCANIAKFPLHDWVYRYDSQSHCEAEFDVVMEAIRTGRAYIPKDVDGMHGEEPKACRL